MKQVQLSRGEMATVDDEDHPLVAQYKWHANKKGYAVGSIPTGRRGARHVLMHRLILGAQRGEQVDHVDGKPLNNTRANLRIATHSENCRNSIGKASNRASQFKGLNWDRKLAKWRVYIGASGRSIYVGIYADELQAALAYDQAARQHHGDYACLNFPDLSQTKGTDWQCQLCNRRQDVVELVGLYVDQRMRLCLACIRFVSEVAQPGDVITRDPAVRQCRGTKPVIKKG